MITRKERISPVTQARQVKNELFCIYVLCSFYLTSLTTSICHVLGLFAKKSFIIPLKNLGRIYSRMKQSPTIPALNIFSIKTFFNICQILLRLQRKLLYSPMGPQAPACEWEKLLILLLCRLSLSSL